MTADRLLRRSFQRPFFGTPDPDAPAAAALNAQMLAQATVQGPALWDDRLATQHNDRNPHEPLYNVREIASTGTISAPAGSMAFPDYRVFVGTGMRDQQPVFVAVAAYGDPDREPDSAVAELYAGPSLDAAADAAIEHLEIVIEESARMPAPDADWELSADDVRAAFAAAPAGD